MSENALLAFKREMQAIDLPVSPDIPIEKMRSALMVAVQRNPVLLTADRSTLWLSIRMCAADGLIPDNREAALVIYKTKKKNREGQDEWVDAVQYIPMVFGLRKRALNSAEVADIREYLVYEGEWTAGRFKMIAGDEERIEHQPIIPGAPGEPERGEIIGGYAIAVMKDGSRIRHWMTVGDIEKRRRASPSQRVYAKGAAPRVSDEPLGVWRDWQDEQYRKTLVRGLSKKLPLSSDDQRAVQESDHDFDGVSVEQVPKAPSLAARLMAAQQTPEEQSQDTGPALEDQSQDEVEEADVVAPAYDPALAFPMETAFEEGVVAAKNGLAESDCPYDTNPAFSNWIGGHRGAMSAQKGSK